MNPIVSLATAGATGLDIPLWLTAPFALLLLLIAVMPLTPPRVKHLWDRYYMHTALGLGLAVGVGVAVGVTLGGGVTPAPPPPRFCETYE